MITFPIEWYKWEKTRDRLAYLSYLMPQTSSTQCSNTIDSL